MTVITSTGGGDPDFTSQEGTLICPAYLYSALPPAMHRPNIHTHIRTYAQTARTAQPAVDHAQTKKIRQTPQANTFAHIHSTDTTGEYTLRALHHGRYTTSPIQYHTGCTALPGEPRRPYAVRPSAYRREQNFTK